MTLRKMIVAGGMVASAFVLAATAQARPHHPPHGHWHHPVHHRHWHHR